MVSIIIKIPTTVTKEITVGDTDKNNVVKTGDVLTYQVKAFVPFIDAAEDVITCDKL